MAIREANFQHDGLPIACTLYRVCQSRVATPVLRRQVFLSDKIMDWNRWVRAGDCFQHSVQFYQSKSDDWQAAWSGELTAIYSWDASGSMVCRAASTLPPLLRLGDVHVDIMSVISVVENFNDLARVYFNKHIETRAKLQTIFHRSNFIFRHN